MQQINVKHLVCANYLLSARDTVLNKAMQFLISWSLYSSWGEEGEANNQSLVNKKNTRSRKGLAMQWTKTEQWARVIGVFFTLSDQESSLWWGDIWTEASVTKNKPALWRLGYECSIKKRSTS